MSTVAEKYPNLTHEEREFLGWVDERIEELRQKDNELERLQSIRLAMTGKSAAAKPARASGTRQGGRLEEFLTVVKDNPGITVAEATGKMNGIAPNYLYRVKSSAEAKDLIRIEDGGKLFVKDAEPVPAAA